MAKQIGIKERQHICRNIRLMEENYGSSEAAQFVFDAIEWSLAHNRDIEFAGILERSNEKLLTKELTNIQVPKTWREELEARQCQVLSFIPAPQLIAPQLLTHTPKQIAWF